MVSGRELEGAALKAAKAIYTIALACACGAAWALSCIGIHKQIVNRLLEPYGWIYAVITATDTYDDSGVIVRPWEHFFVLRTASDAEPHMRILGKAMQEAYTESIPEIRGIHLPYSFPSEFDYSGLSTLDKLKACAMRCARVSYFSQDAAPPDPARDIARIETLIRDGHHSPLEHVALCAPDSAQWGTQRGWKSLRYLLRDDHA